MNLRVQPILLALLALPLCGALKAQDPTDEIKQIVQRIDEQMRTIDQWLLESARKGEAASKGHELLQKGQQQNEKVVEGIDELIKKLQQMKQRSQSSQSQDQQQQDQQQQGQQRPRNQQNRPRNENPTPELDQQQQEQQQGQNQQQQPQHQPNQPDGPEQSRDPGENRAGNRPPDNGTEKAPPGAGDGSWGELQSYANFLKSRGSAPKVPEKFRKYYEGYLKDQAGKGK